MSLVKGNTIVAAFQVFNSEFEYFDSFFKALLI